MPEIPAVLSLSGAQYAWPGSDRALGPIEANIPQGSWVGLIGPNGAGKSTLLKLIAAYLTPGAGEITVQGQSIHTLSPAARARMMAFVPQTLDTSFDLTVQEVVELGRLNQLSWRERLGFSGRGDSAHVEHVMSMTGVSHLAARPFTTLSGGEAKRALLAAALIQDAPLLLLDEPTAHLDPGHALRFLELIGEMVRSGTTVLMAHHDLATVGLYTDTLWVLHEGQIAAQGPSGEILHSDIVPRIYDAPLVAIDHPRTQRPLMIFP